MFCYDTPRATEILPDALKDGIIKCRLKVDCSFVSVGMDMYKWEKVGKNVAHLPTCGCCDHYQSPLSSRSSDTFIVPLLLVLTTSSSTLRLLGVSHLSCSLERLASERPWAPQRFFFKSLHKLISKNRKSLFYLSLLFSLIILASLMTNVFLPLSQIDGEHENLGVMCTQNQ